MSRIAAIFRQYAHVMLLDKGYIVTITFQPLTTSHPLAGDNALGLSAGDGPLICKIMSMHELVHR
jgi:hypothetical protein